MERTYTKDVINKESSQVAVTGWVQARRDHGKIIFIDLRDASGILQTVFIPSNKEAYAKVQEVRPEWVVKISGTVQKRPENMRNAHIATGNFELTASGLEVISRAETPPFPIDGDGYDVAEDARWKYRYLDMRRPRVLEILRKRAETKKFIRDFLAVKGFIEIDTPILTKSTPEGARDFLVPSRLHQGKFYALPQSPQQYKQLLMVAGFERYFQLARALRDEDLRADRGFEHTQLDLEMSFVEQKDVMELIEGLIIVLFEDFGKKIYKKPFPVFEYKEALKKFGTDKFDLRTKKNPEEVALAWVINFPVFVRDEKTKELTYSHNPFTAPRSEDIPKLLAHKDLENLVSLQYDLVCNGFEIGGGGIRINKAEVLEKVFETLGHSKEKIQKQFGHMLEAFRFGAPPHGGIALGLDRILMILAGEEYLREVVAFPMTGSGETSVMEAPSEVDKRQLDELGLEVKKKK